MPRKREASAAVAPVYSGGYDPVGVVGREEELARLTDFFTADVFGTLLIEGEAGIGKTTLWRAGVEVARRRGYRVLACRPSETESELSYGALGDLVAPVLEEAVSDLPSPQRWALEVSLLLREPGASAPDQRAIGMALLGVLRLLSSDSRVLLAVDDAQWVDQASAGVLEFALRRMEYERAGAFISVRVEGQLAAAFRADRAVPEEYLERLRVGPLSLGALHRLLRARLDVALPRPMLVRVHETAAGNPFYALELTRALVASEGLPEAGRPTSLPETLDELLGARLSRLPRRVRDLLAVAAAMSDPAPATLEEVAEAKGDRLLSDLDCAAAAGIVVLDGDRVRFTHPLLASSAYWHAGEAGRRAIHRRLAAVSTDAEERARHLALGADRPDEEVAAALDEAARQAASRGAARVAAEFAELAARSTPQGSVVTVRRRRAAAAERHLAAGDVARARQILEGLVAEVEAGPERVDLLLLLARGRPDDFKVQGELGRLALRDADGDPARVARAHLWLAGVAAARADEQAAIEHARDAVEAGEAAGDPTLLASCLSTVAARETFLGEATPRLLERAVDLEARAGRLPEYPSATWVMGHRLMYQDRFDEAREWLHEARARARANDDFRSQVQILISLGELETAAGNWDEAAEHAGEGYELGDQLDDDEDRALLLYVGSRVDALRGHVDAAREAATRGIAIARASKNLRGEIDNLRVLGFLELSLGDYAAAAARLEPLAELGDRPLYVLLPDTAEALISAGELVRAQQLVEQLEHKARTTGRLWLRMTAARSRGLLRAEEGDLEAALAALDEALAEHERLPRPFERGRTLLALGQTRRRARQMRAARHSLQEALAVFEALGAPLWAAKARRELSRIGGRAPSAGALTPTEQRVAALVAEGRTNREAAEALYLSEHTIEGHLSRIYSKLGVRSRTELARRLAVGADERAHS